MVFQINCNASLTKELVTNKKGEQIMVINKHNVAFKLGAEKSSRGV